MNTPKILIILGASSFIAINAPCQSLIVDFTSVGESGVDGPYTMGFEFQVNTSLTVSGLAFWAPTSLGDQVGLWNSSGALLTSTTVSSSDPTLGNGFFHYASVSPILLSPGDYIVAGQTASGSPYSFDDNGFSTIPQVTYLRDYFISSSSLTFPTITELPAGSNGFFGGDVVVATVPEPTTVGFLGVTFACIGIIRQARRRQND